VCRKKIVLFFRPVNYLLTKLVLSRLVDNPYELSENEGKTFTRVQF